MQIHVVARSPDRVTGSDRRSPTLRETFGHAKWHGQETVPQHADRKRLWHGLATVSPAAGLANGSCGKLFRHRLQRQLHRKLRAFAGDALHADAAMMLLDDLSAHAQA